MKREPVVLGRHTEKEKGRVTEVDTASEGTTKHIHTCTHAHAHMHAHTQACVHTGRAMAGRNEESTFTKWNYFKEDNRCQGQRIANTYK